MLRFIILSLFLYFAFRVLRVVLLAKKTINRNPGSGFTSNFQGFNQKKSLDEIEEADFTVIKDESDKEKS